MATPWVFVDNNISKRTELYLSLNNEINTKQKTSNYTIPTAFSRYSVANNIIDTKITVELVNIPINNLDQYMHSRKARCYKEEILLWMQYLDIAHQMPNDIFMLIMEYDNIVTSLHYTVEDIIGIPINLHKQMTRASLKFCKSQQKTLDMIRNTPGITCKMPLYSIMAIAHHHNNTICPWAPLHFGIDDDAYFRLIWPAL
jgi:hypothetical protein